MEDARDRGGVPESPDHIAALFRALSYLVYSLTILVGGCTYFLRGSLLTTLLGAAVRLAGVFMG